MSGWAPTEAAGWAPTEAADWGENNGAGFADENVNPGGQAPDGGAGDSWGGDTGGNQVDPSAATERHDNDNKCRNCGNEGHFARECPEPPKAMSCYNCGEEGHTKAECTKPRVFKGPCRICQKEGHPAAECPDKPPDVCKNCRTEGHKTIDCTQNRKFDLNSIPDKVPEDAWAILKKASDERDLADFREGLKIYSKAVPQATFVDIEKRMREENFSIYLIAMEKQVGDRISLIDLQGKLNCKYVVGLYFSFRAQRTNLLERWPANPEENLERLKDAGFPYDRQIPKCTNCNEMGHTARGCKEEHISIDRVEVKCVNCTASGHRARDCTQPRRDRYACRNCGSPEHKAVDCPNPRSADGVECRRCNEVGHFAKDCPQAPAPRTCRNCGSEDHIAKECDKPRDVSTVTCRNCDEVGHFSRDCPKKKDWSKVKCNNCGEMGHTVRRCPQAAIEDFGQGNNNFENNSGHDNNNVQDNAAGDGDWGTEAPTNDGGDTGAGDLMADGGW